MPTVQQFWLGRYNVFYQMNFIQRFWRRGDPAAEAAGPLHNAVKEAIADVQAYARSHGGSIDLVSVSEEGDVRIRLKGTCRGCPMSSITIKIGVEDQLRRLVPGIRRVIQVP